MTEQSCQICRASEVRWICNKNGIPIFRCVSCGTAFADQTVEMLDTETLYGQSYFRSDEPALGYRDYERIADLKRITFDARLIDIERIASRGRLLDVGCATGLFVDMATSRGWETTGIDVSAFAIQQARRYKGTFLVADLMTVSLPPQSFDVITMFDVIEHVRQPIEVLRRAARLLSNRGLLVVETPNVGGLLAWVMGQRWPHYRPPEHLFYFTPASLRLALSQSEFEMLFWSKSIKTMNARFIFETLQLTNPGVAGFISQSTALFPWLGRRNINVPTGSFLVFAQRL